MYKLEIIPFSYINNFASIMEKHSWNKVHCNLKTSSHPSSRWGHSCCLIGQQIIFFGGYADSTYMNDVWSFNTLTMDWNQIQTTGQTPSNRSNCSMNYDQVNNRIILFGGGAPNKKRFNSINILDWNTKEWTEINPKQNESAPWERTYHSAEMFYPYLVVFGGQGITDMDDIWAFNLQTKSWLQINIDKDSTKPCARRFHSSAKIGNQFYVIAGCHGKYRCLCDVYSINLTELIVNGNLNLQWTQRKIKGSTFLTRWGHSSVVFQDKIYIFGGRFSNDLNDILVIDLQKGSMKAVKTGIQVPKARRRHSACFIGSSMVIFGGFNGEYFNDLHYINLFEVKKKAQMQRQLKKMNMERLLDRVQYSDGFIQSLDNQIVPIHKAIIRKSFKCEQKMQQFLSQMPNYSKDQMLEILEYLYKGYDREQFDCKYLNISQTYQITLCDNQSQKQSTELKKLFFESKDIFSLVPKKSSAFTNPVLSLQGDQYSRFLENVRQQTYADTTIVVNKEQHLPVSRCILSIASQYFRNLFSYGLENNELHLNWNGSKNFIQVFEVLCNYLAIGRVIIPAQYSVEQWMQLTQLAEYYCLKNLKNICQQELIKFVNQNLQKVMNFALLQNLRNLSMYCADAQIKQMITKQQKYQIEYVQNQNQKLNMKREEVLKQVYNLLRFDILQSRIQAQTQMQYKSKKQGEYQQKQNYQNNLNI